jgi:Icc-related predicted phosphoesterase
METKIIALADIHDGGIQYLDKLAEDLATADVVLLVGDLTNNGKWADAERVVNAVRQYNESILSVPGNWDGPEVADYLTKANMNLHGRQVIFQDVAFVGVGGALPSIGQTVNEITESQFEAFLARAISGLDPAQPQILVSHQPPINTTADKAGAEFHVGSYSVREFVEQTKPLICFSGHIHSGIGIDTIGRTKIVNPGALWQGGYAYALLNEGQVVDLQIKHWKVVSARSSYP